MVSNKQLRANQQNAKHGGVKTPEGKAVTRYNARKHAILSKYATEYDEGDHVGMLNILTAEYGDDPLNKHIIEQAAMCYLQLQRANKAESEYIKSILCPRETRLEGYELSFEPVEFVINEGYSPTIEPTNIEVLQNIYCRYQTTLENRLCRLLHLLEARRTKLKDKEA